MNMTSNEITNRVNSATDRLCEDVAMDPYQATSLQSIAFLDGIIAWATAAKETMAADRRRWVAAHPIGDRLT